jgi:hypothetical protein
MSPIGSATLLVEQPRELPGMDAQDVSSQVGPEFRCDFDQTPPEDWDLGTESAEYSTETDPSPS